MIFPNLRCIKYADKKHYLHELTNQYKHVTNIS